ncbi:MAG TPA: type I-E CRISPR-associated protein Cse1/CasA [Tahibacter sp.]|nr:type I-E CRISPR-associated protein Cse1/CasA [Tahibacter sp.]
MNLLFDPWIPVVTAAGTRKNIAPVDLTASDDVPVDLAAVRHDFDGALAQFLIGACQSFLPPRDDDAWKRHLRTPPTRDELAEAFTPHRAAFELFDAEHPFQQDTSLGGDPARADGVVSLLIDAPGGNTQKENKDIFVKRGRIAAFAPDVAAQALVCLQINAPSGGVGYRTGLRGGGPLTTLVWPRLRYDAATRPTTLWEKVWLNVVTVGWDGDDVEWPVALPWLSAVRTSRKGDRYEEITGGALHHGSEADPLCWWASPRRIRLLRGDAPARCDLTGEVVDRPVVGVFEENYGPNYRSDRFEHPLSPYARKDEASPWLPLHPRGGGLGFRDWPTLCAASGDEKTRKAAATVRELARPARRHALRALGIAKDALWAFGYQMDNAKVLTWQESRLPLFPHVDDTARLAQFASLLVAAAEKARNLLRGALREVLGDAGATSIDAAERALFDRAESPFYAALDHFTALVHDDITGDRDTRERWASTLRRALLDVFDAYADAADVVADTSMRHLRAVTLARGALLGEWQSQYRKILNLPSNDDAPAARSRKAGSAA